jgi:serine/threonine-protein kinase HipA
MNCLSCHKETNSAEAYHNKCLKDLFGVGYAPKITFSVADLPARVSQTAGKMSISGVQIKASVKLNPSNKQLEIAAEGGTYILKPEPTEYPELPQNENLVMNMAHELKMKVPPHGLFEMADGKFCYIIKRFDRSSDGHKIHKEDMAQLLQLPTDAKYTGGSLEAVGNVVKAHTANAYLELFDFFQRVAFNFAIGNGDMHLKNWSLLTPATGENSLTPCYDFVDSKMYLPDEEDFALPMGGKKNKLHREDFEKFAKYFGLDTKAASNAINSIVEFEPKFLAMTRASFLSIPRQNQLVEIIMERIRRLKA